MDALKRAELELAQEIDRQVDLVYSSAGIALHRHWNWGSLRIRRLFDLTVDVWGECGGVNDTSMLQMLEDETGVELKISDTDKGWREIAFLNAKLRRMSRAQQIYMRQRQKQWVSAQAMACMALALHRKDGFGATRIIRLMGQIDDVKEEFNFDRTCLLAACEDEAGVALRKEKA